MLSTNAASVYKSAADAFSKQNKELYPKMLDSLTQLMQQSQPSAASDLLDDQRVRFHFTHVLPLLFDADTSLQQKAIETIEAVLPHMKHTTFDTLPDWPAIKDTISEQYCKNVNVLRDRHNSNWHQVWSILVRIIHKDILRSATLINRYLSIVEQGFRNANLTVRAEAFLCWHVLVQLFATHNELLAPKRIKLVCIPLKSSQSKTEQIAVNKFSVWWFLMSEVHDRLVDYTDTIVEPFLVFCFGPLGIQPLIGLAATAVAPITAPGKTFEKLTPMCVGALSSLLGAPDEAAAALVQRVRLLPLRQPFNSADLFAKIGKALINSTGEATLLAAKMSTEERRQEIVAGLWRHVMGHVNVLQCYDHFNLVLDNLYALENCITHNADLAPISAHVVHTVATIPSFIVVNAGSDIDRVFVCIQRFLLLLLSTAIVYTNDQINDVLGVCLNLDAITTATGCSFRELTKRLIRFVTNARPGNISAARLAIWHKLAEQFTKHSQRFAADDVPMEAVDREMLHAFVVAPIAIVPDQFDSLRTRWLTVATHVIEMKGGRDGFTRRALAALRLHSTKSPSYNGILATLIDLEDHAFVDALPEHLFDHVDYLCTTTSAATTIKDLNVIVHALVAFVRRLDGPQLLRAYRRLKAVHGRLEATVPTLRCDRAVCAEFRAAVAQHLRTRKATQTLIRELGAGDEALRKELLDMLNVDSDFVVIPNVWRFNPDRLTDQQRDKMRERRVDIPALYNDTSQSQESRSIKPWTPQKLDVAPETPAAAVVVVDADRADCPNGDPTASTAVAATATAATTTGRTDPATTTTQPSKEPNSPESSASSQTTTANKRKPMELRKLHMDIVAVDEYQHKSSSARITRNPKTTGINCSPRSTSSSPSVSGAERGPSVCSSADERENGVDAPKTTSAEKTRMRRKSVDGSALQTPAHMKDRRVTRQRPATATRPKLGQIAETASDQQESVHSATKTGKTKMRRLVYPSTTSEKTTAPVGKKPAAESSKAPAMETVIIDSEEPLAADDVIETSQDPLQSPAKSSARVVLDRLKTNGPMGVDTQTMDTVPMDTECAADVPDLADEINGHRIEALQTAAAQKNVEPADKVVAAADTQSQPSQLSTLNITADDEDTPKPMDTEEEKEKANDANADTEQASDELLPTTAVDLEASVIQCSPECNDLELRNAEMLNDTLNISPIRVDIAPEGSADIVDISTLVNLPVNAAQAVAAAAVVPVASTSSPPSSQSQVLRALSSTPLQSNSNNNSPSSRYSQFKGRGAQLLNIIANKKIKHNDDATVDAAACSKALDDISNAFEDVQPLAALPTPKRNLLTFSKTLPSPLASPSSSILKRKLPADDATETPLDSYSTPVLKKKRVSFHDPPVSVTKEYIGHADEHNERPSMTKLHLQQHLAGTAAVAAAAAAASTSGAAVSRSPALGKSPNAAANNFNRVRNVLQRMSRANSMVEFAKLNRMNSTTSSPLGTSNGGNGSTTIVEPNSAAATAESTATTETATPTPPAVSVDMCATADMEQLQWNSSTVSSCDSDAATQADTELVATQCVVDTEDMISTAELDELIAPAPAALRAYDQATILRHVREHCTLDQVLAAYAPTGGPAGSGLGRLLTRELSALMRTDERCCRETLEQLSEDHSAQFLNHAIVENLGSTVCARLAPGVLIEHLRGVTQTDDAVRSDLRTMLAQTATETEAVAVEKVAPPKDMAEKTTDVRMEAVHRLLDDRQAGLGAEEMAVMRRLLDRPLSDQQICDFMGIFSRNRQN